MEFADIKNRSKAFEQGEWIDKIPGLDPEVKFCVRSTTSPRYVAELGRLLRNIRDDQRQADGQATEEALRAIDLEALATVALIDWDGLTSKGEQVAFSPGLALQWAGEAELFEHAIRFAVSKVTAKWSTNVEALAGN